MFKAAQDLYEKCLLLHQDFQRFAYICAEPINLVELSEEQMADTGFLFREAAATLDEIRKDAEAQRERVSLILGGICVGKFTETSDPDSFKVKGTLANAHVEVRTRPQMPNRGTPEYHQLMSHFGVPDIAIETGAIVPHYMRMMDLCTKLAEEGNPPPPGLLGTRAEPAVKFVRKRKKGQSNDE